MENTNHYICTGSCHGESQTPGTCQAGTCEKHNQPLIPCNCGDHKHEAPAPTENTEQR